MNNNNADLQKRLVYRLSTDQAMGVKREPLNALSSEDMVKEIIEDAKADSKYEEVGSNTEVSVSVEPETDVPEDTSSAPGDELFDSTIMDEVEKDSNMLIEKMNAIEEAAKTKLVEQEELAQETASEEEIDDLLDSFTDANEEPAPNTDINTEEDVFATFDSLPYADVVHSDNPTGPASYVIEIDKEYLNNIDSILEGNNVTVTKVSEKERIAALNRFTSSGSDISMQLPNSGIYVTMSGAGIDEVSAMGKIDTGNEYADAVSRLRYVADHITNSTVGPIALNSLINIVSMYDLNTLYYALFAATYPNEVDVMRTCPQCGKEFNAIYNTRDLLINPQEYEDTSKVIKENVSTYSTLLNASKLSKLHQVRHENGMIVYYRHPSIRDYLDTGRAITNATKQKYGDLSLYAHAIKKIEIPYVSNGTTSYLAYDNPNEVIRIIASLRGFKQKAEIVNNIDELLDGFVPKFGYTKCTCPHCKYEIEEEESNIASMLFTQAQFESLRAMIQVGKSKKQKEKK